MTAEKVTGDNAESPLYGEESKSEDLSLIEQVKGGSFGAFERIVKKYESRIYNHCLKFLNSQEDAEDVLQETFLQVYRSLDSFRGDSAFSTWLFKIATNGCLMRIRKKKKVDLVSIDKPMEFDGSSIQREIVDWSKNPALMHGNEEIRTVLDRIISELPEDKKIVLIMKDVEGFSNIEIGQILNMSVAAVKSRLHRARLIMREELTNYFNGIVGASKTLKGRG
ncbi:MAG: sigma-70 family RNA polymerase sigma factor [Nitrospinae bacterium]|nr:sigma-70 family RNA polymerase sigma factor [Nitrospinota bacterium]